MPELDRHGVRIAYDVAGSGPVVLLTHGYAASAAMFGAVVEGLAGDHTVVTWDRRGHARSDSPDDPALYSPELEVGDMLALLDAVGAESAAVGGHSLGGYTSMLLTVTAPSRVRALVLIDTGPGFRNDEARARWNDVAESYARQFDARGLEALGGGDEVNLARHMTARGLALSARGILTQRDATVIDALPSIGVPTLVVVGEHDDGYLDGSRYMAYKIPGARLEVIEGAGHVAPVTHPDVFLRVLRSFLSEVEHP